MGMFDTIVTEPFKCPHCKKDVDAGFQTKDGPKSLHVYKIGDEFSVCVDQGCYWIWKTQRRVKIKVYASCPNCYTFIDGYGILERKTNKILRIELVSYKVQLKNKIQIRE